MSLEDAIASLEATKRDRTRTGEVCICGHSFKAHEKSEASGQWSCNMGKVPCFCAQRRLALVTPDLRLFRRSTAGSGFVHALGAGMLMSVKGDIPWEWQLGGICDRCKADVGEDGLAPVAALDGLQADSSVWGVVDEVWCRACRMDVAHVSTR